MLTQRQLAIESSISEATIRAIETGRAGRVRFSTMVQLTKALSQRLGKAVRPQEVDDFIPSFQPRHSRSRPLPGSRNSEGRADDGTA